MNDVCAFILGICHPHRLEWLKQCVSHLDKQPFTFERKLVVLDEFNGHKATDEIKNFLKERGWELKIVSYHSRSRTMQESLNEIKEDLVYYIEDDVLLDLPPKKELLDLFEIMIEDRLCGHISPQIGGGQYCSTRKIWGDIEFLEKNTVYKSENFLAFRRMEEYKTDYFITFPCVLFRTKLFKDCVDQSISIFKGRQIETGITSAYFFSNFDKDYYKLSICKPDTMEKLKQDMKNERACGFVTLLDPEQGSNVCGGGNII